MNKHKWWFTLTLTASISGCDVIKTMNGDNLTGNSKPVALNDARLLADCEELSTYMKLATSYRNSRRSTIASDAKALGSANPSSSQTKVQEVGVDEGDVVKVGEDQIFFKRDQDVVVIDRATKSEVGYISIVGDDGKATSLDEIYLHDSTLVVIAAGAQTKINLYETKIHAIPQLKRSLSLLGRKQDSRIIGDYLIAATSTDLEGIRVAQEKLQNNSYLAPTCRQVVTSPVADGSTGATILNAIHLNSDQDAESIGLTTNTSVLYATPHSIFLASTNYQYDANDMEETFISQVDFDSATGAFKLRGNGHVKGRIKDRWALKAPDNTADQDLLFVTTSSGQLFRGGNSDANNHLFTLKNADSTLKQIAELSDFGKGEDVRAVQYVGQMAYVVTFKKTDPLFAIDLTEPTAPKLTGELQMPGFSTQLHPLADGKHLVGIGFNADDQGDFAWFQGIQVSLFDVSDPSKLTRITNKVIGGRGSSSEATADSHAFFYDATADIMAIPYTEVGAESNKGPWDGDYVSSGAIFFKLDENGFSEMNRVSHTNFMSAPCLNYLKNNKNWWWSDRANAADIRRIFALEDELYTVSNYGLSILDSADPGKVVKSVAFSQQPDCSDPYGYKY